MAIQPSPQDRDVSFDEFSQAQFDPVTFLNDNLPMLNLSSQALANKQTRSTILQTTSTNIQPLLSSLSAHSIRSSSELTTLTDEILRSGNRLAYEVEVLRGDVNSLYELLTDSLKDDISRFVIKEAIQNHMDNENAADEEESANNAEANALDHHPDFIRQLRVLETVKSRLETVIHIFGEALKWPVAPSEVSVASSLISVSAPELGIATSAEDNKAHAYARKLRNEIVESLDSDGGKAAGLETATKKVDNLRALSLVWKGTAEEKARTKMVDSLAKLIEDKRKTLEARSVQARSGIDGSAPRSSSLPGRAGRIVEGPTTTAAGLFRNLQKLRDEIYLD